MRFIMEISTQNSFSLDAQCDTAPDSQSKLEEAYVVK